MKAIFNRLFQYQTLDRSEAEAILMNIASGQLHGSQISSFLTIYMMRPITLDELLGFRDAMLNLCIRIDLHEFNTIDVCGTGGDGHNTFNISTIGAFLLAGSGEKVAKHGNYGVSSNCGSSNILEYFGYKFSASQDKLRNELDKTGICFLHAPLFNPAMKEVGGIRRELGVKTFFNMLGPMVNPSVPANQLVGVYNNELARLYRYAYELGETNYSIIHSTDGYDEVSLTGPFRVITRNGEQLLTPELVGMQKLEQEQLFGGNTVEEAAAIFMHVLNGKGTQAQNDVVLINSAMALQVLHPDQKLEQCVATMHETLFSGKGLEAFRKLISLNN
ncbi:MAG: anthranilate phosphoribosyltransferase [Bacteroidota bacterium]|nr:anthranilate phosphoribosyltransferase [Bacteroidota bacterium]